MSAATCNTGSEQTVDITFNNLHVLFLSHFSNQMYSTSTTVVLHPFKNVATYLSRFRSRLQSSMTCLNTKYTNGFITGITMTAQCNSCNSSYYSTSPTMFFVRSTTNGTEPGLLCARRFASFFFCDVRMVRSSFWAE